jgi:phospholipase/carboxylesterase
MPRFAATIRGLQLATGTTAEQTVLIGFSQGAIMALESTQVGETLAEHVVAIAGRFAQLPSRARTGTALHFIHGESDPVIAVGHAVAAAERLAQLDGNVTIDLIPGLGHGISRLAEDVLIERLKG